MGSILQAVAASGDDGHTDGTNLFTNATYTWFEAGNDGSNSYDAFFRFTGISIPAGCTITSATLYYVANQWDTGTLLKIYVEEAAAPTAPSTAADLAGRAWTTASVNWTVGYGDNGWHDSISFAAALQEVVNSQGALSAVQILVADNSSPSGSSMTGATYDNAGYAPQLHVEYTTEGGGGGAAIATTYMINYDDPTATYNGKTVTAIVTDCYPDILIINTISGMWGINWPVATHQAAGCEVYSYVDLAYGAAYSTAVSYINAILTNDGPDGIFVDQVWQDTQNLTEASNLWTLVHTTWGKKLILNTGQPEFNLTLLNYCDYLMSSETWQPSQGRTAAQASAGAKCLICTRNVSSAADAYALTDSAVNTYGFTYHYSSPIGDYDYKCSTWTEAYFDLLNAGSTPTEYYILTINIIGSGTVGTNPNPPYVQGDNDVVTITATASAGYTFTSWSGSVASTTANPTTVTMSGNQIVTATFVLDEAVAVRPLYIGGGDMAYLRANTAVTILIGPFMDDTDGKTPETGLTISQADVRLSKNGGNMAQKNESTSCTHDELGYYTCPLDATDTNTEGVLALMVNETGAFPVKHSYMVLSDAAYTNTISAGAAVDDILEDTASTLNNKLDKLTIALGILDELSEYVNRNLK